MDTRKALRLDEKNTTLAIERKRECKGEHPPPPKKKKKHIGGQCGTVWTFLSAARTLNVPPSARYAVIGDVG